MCNDPRPLKEVRTVATTSAPNVIPAGTWKVDPTHSTIAFKVTDVTELFATINGHFEEFEGVIEAGERLGDADIRGRITAFSLTTHQQQRDAHLTSPDFLDAARYPEITFESTSAEATPDGIRVHGTLVLKGNPQAIELQGRVHGAGRYEAGGVDRLVIEAHTELPFGPMRVEIKNRRNRRSGAMTE
jgi:polyisoprenoid-binding protein YceI